MTKSLKSIFKFAFLASLSLYGQIPEKQCDVIPGLSQKDLEVITANPNVTFVYLSTDVIKVLRGLDTSKMPEQVHELAQYLELDYKAVPVRTISNAIDCAIECCTNDRAKRSVLEHYKEDLASGDAVISISDVEVVGTGQEDQVDAEITRSRKCKDKKSKCFCRLTVRDCLKTKNLINCGNAVIGGNLRVNGTINGFVIDPSRGISFTANGLTASAKVAIEPLLNIRGTICITKTGLNTFSAQAARGTGFTIGSATAISDAGANIVNVPVIFISGIFRAQPAPSITTAIELTSATTNDNFAFSALYNVSSVGFNVSIIVDEDLPIGTTTCVNFIAEGLIA